MRIAIVSNESLSETVQTAAYMKARSLADRGHDVYLLYPCALKGGSSFDGHIRLLGVGLSEMPVSTNDSESFQELFSSQVAESLEALDLAVRLDVVEFPDHGYEGHAYLIRRDASVRFPVIVQNRGPLNAFASAIGKSRIVFQPTLPAEATEPGAVPSRLEILKAETFYHFAVNRTHSRLIADTPDVSA
jgi:hypothetical protein